MIKQTKQLKNIFPQGVVIFKITNKIFITKVKLTPNQKRVWIFLIFLYIDHYPRNKVK